MNGNPRTAVRSRIASGALIAFALAIFPAGCGGGGVSVAPPTPVPSSTATPAARPTSTPTPAPTATPTATATPLVMTVSSTSLSFTSNAAQYVTVSEPGYSGAFTQSNTCSGIATVAPADADGPSSIFTVTPVNGGSCNLHFAGSSGVTANVLVGVTTISIPAQ